MSDLDRVRIAASRHLGEIAALFRVGAKLTLLVRHDLGPHKDADFVLTDDALPAAIEALERRDAYDVGPRGRDDARPMKRIPIRAARAIADTYGYDQVVIYGRRVGEAPAANGEHLTTYGVDSTHCGVAARMADTLKRFMGWNA